MYWRRADRRYRVEQIFKHRHGIELSRKTMSDWMDHVAHWFKPLYNLIREELLMGAINRLLLSLPGLSG